MQVGAPRVEQQQDKRFVILDTETTGMPVATATGSSKSAVSRSSAGA
jgi:DNA polymerase III epsilon subunit-like protein